MSEAIPIIGLTQDEHRASVAVADARLAIERMKPVQLCGVASDVACRIEGSQRALIIGGYRAAPDPEQMKFAAGLWQLSDIMAEVCKTAAREKEFRDLFKRWMRGR